MKTNSERAKIILDRVYAEKQAPVLEMKNKPAKKKLSWRMITAICNKWAHYRADQFWKV